MPTILQNHYVLAVHDMRASPRFYVEALGFTIAFEPPGWIFVERDGVMIMLGECPDDMPATQLGCHSYFAYLRVDDVDAFHARVKQSGMGSVRDVIDQPWCMREFALTTPDGHRIMIGQRNGA